ncbi:MAG: hypothetical protein UX47_C0004G0020 [Candidatus Collierbacteria bacterium GW2011_GWA2_46_26]|uniref:Uncharacterized protein n=1 Tax=Candidatus Collierbacteria bacterium GW2011_GWA2_46_26 TaxID=1618381 RepID=A0A0G1SJ75_9BACT|nr:MAG: hypothetical protein UX47_C0004G0020 [Candidatus Collierbacteria bacterium GW2011_GWA2_46_26]
MIGEGKILNSFGLVFLIMAFCSSIGLVAGLSFMAYSIYFDLLIVVLFGFDNK